MLILQTLLKGLGTTYYPPLTTFIKLIFLQPKIEYVLQVRKGSPQKNAHKCVMMGTNVEKEEDYE
jgi:hypothetical protein